MASTEMKTNEQRSQAGAVAPRRAYDPLGLPLSPFGLLGLNPFALMGQMLSQFEPTGRRNESAAVAWLPAVEVAERDGKLIVRADLPGLKPDQVRVEVRDGMLMIEGESKLERDEDEKGIHRSERRYGRFVRGIPLPDGAKLDQAVARLDNGVLEVSVPIDQPAGNQRQIPIQAGSSNQPSSGGQSSSSKS